MADVLRLRGVRPEVGPGMAKTVSGRPGSVESCVSVERIGPGCGDADVRLPALPAT